MYSVRMEDGDSMIEHLNSFNSLVSQLIHVNIKMDEEDKCITCSLLDSWDNLVLAIGSTTQFTLKFEVVVVSLLSEEMRRKSMENHSIDALSMRLGCSKDRRKSTRVRSKYRDRSKSLGDTLKKLFWNCDKDGNFKNCTIKKCRKREGVIRYSIHRKEVLLGRRGCVFGFYKYIIRK